MSSFQLNMVSTRPRKSIIIRSSTLSFISFLSVAFDTGPIVELSGYGLFSFFRRKGSSFYSAPLQAGLEALHESLSPPDRCNRELVAERDLSTAINCWRCLIDISLSIRETPRVFGVCTGHSLMRQMSSGCVQATP